MIHLGIRSNLEISHFMDHLKEGGWLINTEIDKKHRKVIQVFEKQGSSYTLRQKLTDGTEFDFRITNAI